jgi:hypothetical protein
LKVSGSAGQSFNYSRWRELVFFVRLMLAFKRLAAKDQARILADGWAFAQWLTIGLDARIKNHAAQDYIFPIGRDLIGRRGV